MTIETFVGISGEVLGEPFDFRQQDEETGVVTNLDISGWDFEIVVTEGPPEFPGEEVHRFTEADGEIERDDDNARFTLRMSQETADEILAGRYSFRALLFLTGESDPFDIPFRGWFVHRRSGE